MSVRLLTPRIWWLLILPLLALAVPAHVAAQAPQSDTAKWLAATDAKWQATYQRDVAGPFENGLAELRREYLASLATPLAAATGAAGEQVAIWTAERQRIASGENVPPTDDAAVPAPLRSLRKNYREQWARLDKQRFDRARGLFAQCDAVLAKNQAALIDRNRTNEAADLQKERDQLRTAWLQPPAVVVATPSPSPGGTAAPVKLTPRQILGKLLALGAGVWVRTVKGGDPVEVKSATQMTDEKFTFARVELRAQRPDETPLVAGDYAILDSLSELPELSLSGENVTDAVLEKLRPFHVLQSLTLESAKISATSYNLLPALPELRELWLGSTGTNDDALKTIAQCRKLKSLHLVTQPIGDDGLANLGKLPALEELELNELEKLGSAGFAHLADCRSLKQISAVGFTILSGMVENLARCKNLEVITLPGSVLKDADIAPLSTLTKLRTLDLDGSSVTGAAFASWPMRLQVTSLNLNEAAGVDDASLKNIEHAFPKLEELNVKLAPSGFSTAGAATFGKLRSLHTMRIGGAGVTDAVMAQLAHCDGLTSLAIPEAQLGDPGVAALVKLPHLAELTLNQPPLTDAALKSFGRCKELKTVNIGKDAAPETEAKLQRAVPGLAVHRPEE